MRDSFEPGIIISGADARKESSVEAARDALLQTVEGMISVPPTKAEVERARTQLLKEIDLELNSPERVGLALVYAGMRHRRSSKGRGGRQPSQQG